MWLPVKSSELTALGESKLQWPYNIVRGEGRIAMSIFKLVLNRICGFSSSSSSILALAMHIKRTSSLCWRISAHSQQLELHHLIHMKECECDG